MVTTQTHQIRVPAVTAADLFAWHSRPGAVLRLTPTVLGRVAAGPDRGLQVGSRTRLRVGPNPLSPIGGRAGVPWTAVHTAVRAPGSHPSDDSGPYGFVDEQESGPFRSWCHDHTFQDVPGGATVRDEVTWSLPRGIGALAHNQLRRQVQRMVEYRSRQLLADVELHRRTAEHGTHTVAITGASGLVGRQLAALLGSGGHRVIRLVRGHATGADEISWDPDRDRLDHDQLRDVDVVVHLAGAPIGRRFTPAHKESVLTSRTRGTGLIARALADISGDGRSRALVSASAMGWYGDGVGAGSYPADMELTEDLPPGDAFLSEVCEAWESAADPAREAGVRTVHVRTGIVQSASGGQLALQLPLFRAGLGGPLGDGQGWMSWISIDDLVGLYAVAALTPGLMGPVNAAAPHPVRAEEYAAVLARTLARPAGIRVPRFGPQLLLGDEGARELAFASLRLSSDRAVSWGHRYRHPTLEDALRHELCR